MKKVLILHILLWLFLMTCDAQIPTTNNLVQARRIGYTTNYGNSFQTNSTHYTFKSVNIHQNGMVTNTGNYKPAVNHHSPSTSYKPGVPRKSAERPYSGELFEDFVDWLRMNTDSDWPSYVDEDYWEEFLAKYPEYEDEARKYFEERGMYFPGDPEDPFAEPLEGEIIVLSLFALVYGINCYKNRKTVA